MSTAVLLLNVDRTPIKVIGWQRAVRLVLDDKAEILVGYAHRAVRSTALTSWLNVVTACYACNTHKAARTPEEAGMPLLFRPTRPGPWDALRILTTKMDIPDEWKAHLPAGSDWAGYWDAELS